jgi:hypothetical protein
VLTLGELEVVLQCSGYIKRHDDGFVGVGRDAFDAQGMEVGAHKFLDFLNAINLV